MINLQTNLEMNVIIDRPSIKPISSSKSRLIGIMTSNSHLFRSVYFHKEERFASSKKDSDKLIGTTKTYLARSNSCDSDINLVKFAKIKYQQEIILKKLFWFSNADNQMISANGIKRFKSQYSDYFIRFVFF